MRALPVSGAGSLGEVEKDMSRCRRRGRRVGVEDEVAGNGKVIGMLWLVVVVVVVVMMMMRGRMESDQGASSGPFRNSLDRTSGLVLSARR